jgi:type II restriction enzyme
MINQKIAEALQLLQSIGIPIEGRTPRQKQRMALALLAVAKMKPDTPWAEATIFDAASSWKPKSREIIAFWNAHWGEEVSPGSYDDVRRKDLLHLTLSGLVLAAAGQSGADPNNPTRGYAINKDAKEVLRGFGTQRGRDAAAEFLRQYGELKKRLEKPREKSGLPVMLPHGVEVELGRGRHNQLQKAIVEEFIPRFVRKPKVLYLGDTAKKALHIDGAGFAALGMKEPAREMLPDIVVFDEARGWVFLIEAVHSANPISSERHISLEAFTKDCKVPKVYVSVFENRASLRKWLAEIGWETEVWLTDSPGHLIHFDGEKFLGPYGAGE